MAEDRMQSRLSAFMEQDGTAAELGEFSPPGFVNSDSRHSAQRKSLNYPDQSSTAKSKPGSNKRTPNSRTPRSRTPRGNADDDTHCDAPDMYSEMIGARWVDLLLANGSTKTVAVPTISGAALKNATPAPAVFPWETMSHATLRTADSYEGEELGLDVHHERTTKRAGSLTQKGLISRSSVGGTKAPTSKGFSKGQQKQDTWQKGRAKRRNSLKPH